jgi:hypothetical protein
VNAFIRAVEYSVAAAKGISAFISNAIGNTVYSPTMRGKAAQGATEISNALYSGQSNAYSPYTADTTAHRAQYQSATTGRGLAQ